jgi:hypothetical protein
VVLAEPIVVSHQVPGFRSARGGCGGTADVIAGPLSGFSSVDFIRGDILLRLGGFDADVHESRSILISRRHRPMYEHDAVQFKN